MTWLLRTLPCLLPHLSQWRDENHCDFVKSEMLIRVNMEDLREQTHTRHYRLYRRCKLEEMGFKDTDPDLKPFRYAGTQQSAPRQQSPGCAGVPPKHSLD